MKTKLQIIDETVEYYSNHPRSMLSDGRCRYLGTNGARCAFARCCEDTENFIEGVGVFHLPVDNLDDILRPEYRGHSVTFWKKIQTLHDYHDNWEDGQLTVVGKNYVEELKKTYENQS